MFSEKIFGLRGCIPLKLADNQQSFCKTFAKETKPQVISAEVRTTPN